MHTVNMLLSKVHGIRVTEANLLYRGSLTLDGRIMDAAGLLTYQQVLVVNNDNGERLETYLIRGQEGSGVCCLNGAAAHKGAAGHTLIVMGFGQMDPAAAQTFRPRRLFVDGANNIETIETD